jgi:Ca-activated chloride channel family protein
MGIVRSPVRRGAASRTRTTAAFHATRKEARGIRDARGRDLPRIAEAFADPKSDTMNAPARSAAATPERLLPPHGWRGLARLVLEGLAAGLFASLVLALAVFIAATQAQAAPMATKVAGTLASDTRGGALRLASSDELPAVVAPLVATDVSVDVAGIVSRTKVTQRFVNPTEAWREGVYLFPLPEGAAVDHMRVETGGRVIEGEIRERGAAKLAYESAKREGRQAGLVEQERPNLFTTSVALLPPDAEVVVTIEFQETLRYDSGSFRLRYPLAITPRYVPAESRVRPQFPSDLAHLVPDREVGSDPTFDDAGRIVAPFALPGERTTAPVTMSITIDAGFPLASIESTSHALDVDTLPDGRVHVALAEGSVPADRDLELAWTPAVGAAPGAAVFTEQRNGRTQALVMILPPSGDATGPALPREATFVVDTSGSMSGTSIAQAKEATQFALSRLAPGDRFNVIEFNSRTRALFAAPMPVDETTIGAARRFVDALRADGGTEMKPALAAALSPDAAQGYARQVFFLTDGAVGNEHELLALIRNRLGDRRLYTIAIGPSPNAWFIRKAAQVGRGTSTFIGDVRDVRERMTELFAKLERPVLTDLSLTWPVGADVYPSRLPDLYAGEPIVVSASFDGPPKTLSVVGRRGKSAWGALLPTGAGTPAAGVGALWAREKIRALSDAIIEGAPEDEVKPLIVATALENHLVSKYTSLVAVDVTPIAPAGTTPERTAIPGLLPAGLDPAGFIGGVPQTATPATLLLVVGIVLLALAGFARQAPRAAGAPAPIARDDHDSAAARIDVPMLALGRRVDLARRIC